MIYVFLTVWLLFVTAIILFSLWLARRLNWVEVICGLIPSGILLALLPMCIAVSYNRRLCYEGHVGTKAMLSSARPFVREQLSILPDGARDIYYSVCPYPPPSTRVSFHLSETEFKDWMGDKDLVHLRGEYWSVLDVPPDPDSAELVDEGRYWSGDIHKSLSGVHSYLNVKVIYDLQKQKVYYEHYEIHGDPGS